MRNLLQKETADHGIIIMFISDSFSGACCYRASRRDLDRQIFRRIAAPWLEAYFHLPAGWTQDPAWRVLSRLTMYACEQAKIGLSSLPQTEIRMDEMRLNMKDLDGEEIDLDAPLTQEDVNHLLEETIQETLEVTRQTLKKVCLTEKDIGQIIFIGGPTKYAPLRERVLAELGIPAGVSVDQMTAVAEGASIYAESVDWGGTSSTTANNPVRKWPRCRI